MRRLFSTNKMLVVPTRDIINDLMGYRRSLLEWPFPQMGLMPVDQVFDWVERSQSSLQDDIARMQRDLFSLEVNSSSNYQID